MAEARQAVGFQFAVTSEGVHVEFDRKVLKAALSALARAGKSRYLRIRDAFLRGIFPASPLSLVVIGGAVIAAHYFHYDTTLGLSTLLQNALGRVGVSGGWVPQVVMTVQVCGGWVMYSLFQRYLLRAMLHYHGWMFDGHGRRSFTTRVWGAGVRVFSLFTQPQLYSYQSSLPRLPLPALKDTCRRYLESVKPLLEDEEYAEMERLVEEFKSGPGARMQRYLWFKSWWSNNYVTDWWELYVYLHGRSPIMINSNYYACGSEGIPSSITDPVVRIANLANVFMHLKKDIHYQKIKPLMVLGVVPLCSAQHERTFGTVRRPGKPHDEILHCPDAESDYCVIYHSGRWYKVSLASPSGRLYSSGELECVFRNLWKTIEVEQQAGVVLREGEEHLAALTTLPRDKWAELYQQYFTTGVNHVSMETIEKAAFVVFYDPSEPSTIVKDGNNKDLTAYCKRIFHGNGHSLWFDKSISVIMYGNAMLGVNAEHSWADAPIVGYLMEYASNMEIDVSYDNGHCHGYAHSVAPTTPQRLDWDLDAACVKEIYSAQTFAEEQIADLDLYVMRHDEFGKGAIKKCGISPDAFIQMALQMAYYKDAGKFCLTYEASMTRLYLEGRTETVRPVTDDSARFVRTMLDPAASTEQKKEMLRVATDRHATGYKKAMTGEGIDRHLFCLYVISKYLKLDSPFLSKVLQEPWRLSTSQTPAHQTGRLDYNKHPERISGGGGFGPVAKDGYGVSYIIQGDFVMFFHVSAFNSSEQTNAARFAGHIRESLREIKDLFGDVFKNE